MNADVERRLRALARRGTGVLRGVQRNDLEAMARLLGLEASTTLTRRDLRTALSERMARAMAWPDESTAIDLQVLERHLNVREIADRTSFGDLIARIDVIRDTSPLGPNRWLAPPLDEEARWIEALGAAKDYLIARESDYPPFINPRDRLVAEAIRSLRSHGLEVGIRSGRAELPERERGKVYATLDREIRALGGFEFTEWIFQRMASWYDQDQGRHHVVRRVSTTGKADRTPFTPYAYLLQLAAKHATVSPSGDATNERANAVLDLARAFADAMDVRSISAFEGLFKDRKTLVPFLREIVLFDGTYTLVQARLGDVPRVMRHLFDWVPPETILRDSKCTVSDFADVVDAVGRVATFRGPGILSAAQVRTAVGEASTIDAVATVLDACSHNPTTVNAQYESPADVTKSTFWRKPLIKDPAGYLVLDPAWCAPAFYEVVAAELRAAGERVDEKIGPALERLVQSELRRRGVPCVSGKYFFQGKEYECDVVVETPAQIIVFEIKKKVLQRKSKEGNPITLLLDLADALFAAQNQAARHELALYEQGQLVLDDGRAKHTIVRGNREVERIALTHLDYGSLQDRQIISSVFSVIAGSKISSDDAVANRELQKLEKRGHELADLHLALRGHRDMGPNAFYNCWFLSVGHLLVLLDRVTSPDDLWRELRRTRSMTFGSLDLYFELAEMRSIDPEGPK